MSPAAEARGFVKRYGARAALEDLTFAAESAGSTR